MVKGRLSAPDNREKAGEFPIFRRKGTSMSNKIGNRVLESAGRFGLCKCFNLTLLVLGLVITVSGFQDTIFADIVAPTPYTYEASTRRVSEIPIDLNHYSYEGRISETTSFGTRPETRALGYAEVIRMPFQLHMEHFVLPLGSVDSSSEWTHIRLANRRKSEHSSVISDSEENRYSDSDVNQESKEMSRLRNTLQNLVLKSTGQIVRFTPDLWHRHNALTEKVSNFYLLGESPLMIFVGENVGFFDGAVLHYYGFQKGNRSTFRKRGFAWSPSGGLMFGTSSEGFPYGGIDMGAQGVCRLGMDGVVERVFWPPILPKWHTDKLLIPTSDYLNMSLPYWDMMSLEFSSDNILWIGMLDRVIRLDLDKDVFAVYDETNSEIKGSVMHIAVVGEGGTVRCVCQDFTPNRVGQKSTAREARVVSISQAGILSENLPAAAAKTLNRWETRIVNDRRGNIWFLGSRSLWKSSAKNTVNIADLPKVERSQNAPSKLITDNGLSFFVDSAGRKWRLSPDAPPSATETLVSKRVKQQLPTDRELIIDSQDNIWLKGAENLWLLVDQQWVSLRKDMFPEGKAKDRVEFISMGEDPKGRIWVSWQERGDGGMQPFVSILGQNARKAFDRKIENEKL